MAVRGDLLRERSVRLYRHLKDGSEHGVAGILGSISIVESMSTTEPSARSSPPVTRMVRRASACSTDVMATQI